MKKLLLINPVGRRSGYLLSRFSTFPPLALAYVAAVTPSGWDVKILDENFVEFRFEGADLVGITAFTSNVTRAYEIARTYRRQKIPVIMGGIHASMLPDEALRYADSVIVGEAEGIWKQVIEDFENNALSPKYQGPRVDMHEFTVRPRRDLLHPNYIWETVQTSRGCPFNCDFCSVSQYLGRHFRQRAPHAVLDELKEIQGEYVAFLDDNLIGYSPQSKERAAALFKGMIEKGLSKKWWMQTSLNAAEDEHLVALAAKSGCRFVFIGFETLSRESLREMKKGVNLRIGVENYKKVVDTFHKHGIGVFGAFIIGNDYESADYYRELAGFLLRSGIDNVQISILTPLPGTQLMERLKRERRLLYDNFPEDWDKYRFSYMVHKPLGVDTDTVYVGDNFIKKHLYDFPNYPYRILRSLFKLQNIGSFYASYKFNKALKKSWKNSHYYKTFSSTFRP